MSSSPPEKMELDLESGPDKPLNGAKPSDANPSMAAKFKAIAAEKPPTSNPIGFIAAVLALFCCCLPGAACIAACCCCGLLYQFLPIAEIVVGWLYMEEEYCAQEPIAMLLIIGGSIGCFQGLIECCGGGRTSLISLKGKQTATANGAGENQDQPPEPRPQKQASGLCKLLSTLAMLASLAWLIYAAVVVFRFYGSVSYDEGEDTYCRPILYRFLFWVVVIGLAILALVPACLCCICCVGVCAAGVAAAASD